jgi:hypothetical protein
MEKLIEKFYKEFCKLTNRNGGVLVHSSIGEWHRFLAKKLDEINSIYLTPRIDFKTDGKHFTYYAYFEDFVNLEVFDDTPQEAVNRLVNIFTLFVTKNAGTVRQVLSTRYHNSNFDSIIISDKFGNRYKIHVAA